MKMRNKVLDRKQKHKKRFDKDSWLCYIMDMIKQLEPLPNFNVVAIHRKTGKVQFATIPAPSKKDAQDYVAHMQPDWIVIR